MRNIGEEIKKARIDRNMTISDLSNATCIRSHIIQSIENNDFSVLPDVYIKSFLRTLTEFFDLSSENIENTTPIVDNNETIEPEQNDKIENTRSAPKETVKFDDTEEVVIKPPVEAVVANMPIVSEKPDSKPLSKHDNQPIKKSSKKKDSALQSNPTIQSSSDFSDIFKHNKIKTGVTPGLINYLIYAGVALVLITAIYFTFFFDPNTFFKKSPINGVAIGQDTVVVEKSRNLLDFFSQTDTLTLSAKARDTAWMRIEIDGKSSEEILMLPGMEKVWTAEEFFNVHQGNIGAITFSRNGKQLELFGKRGSVVRNVRITRDEVQNYSPWSNDPTQRFDANSDVPKEKKRYDATRQDSPRSIEPAQAAPRRNRLLERDTSSAIEN